MLLLSLLFYTIFIEYLLIKKEPLFPLKTVFQHEEYSFGGGTVTVTDIESKILQDADNIDAAGAIGIGRTFAFGAAHNCPQYTPEIPLEEGEYNEATFDESTIHHCVNKLARLDQTMNTKTGKEICTQRCEFIRLFVNQYLKEYNCLD